MVRLLLLVCTNGPCCHPSRHNCPLLLPCIAASFWLQIHAQTFTVCNFICIALFQLSLPVICFLVYSSLHTPAGFPGGALVPDLVNHSHQMFASHQGDSLRELASVAVDNPMTTEGLVDPSGDHSCDAMQCIQHGWGAASGSAYGLRIVTVITGNS